jgi:maltose-binding protein MalE
VTLTFIDAEVLHDLSSRKLLMGQALQEFTRQTGIKVNYLPAPENNRDRLALDRKLLQQGSVAPDVYGIDTVWTGNLGDYLIDLAPYSSSELASEDSALLAVYKSQGKQVAMPFHLNVGVLDYARICCTDKDTARRSERGTSLRRWPPASSPVSAPGEKRTFGFCLAWCSR